MPRKEAVTTLHATVLHCVHFYEFFVQRAKVVSPCSSVWLRI